MRISTVCFLLKGKYVLLAPRKDGFGLGNITGYGGKVDRGESITQAVTREIGEESEIAVQARDLTQVALIKRFALDVQIFEIHVFTARKWSGVPKETAEMGDPRWYAFDALPEAMWEGDRLWLPRALAGDTFEADVYLDERGKLTKDIVYRDRTFVREPA